MPTTSQIEVNKLNLDLKNFRTVPQKKETDAIKAMISIKPDRFFAVMESIIDDGYLPTENVIVLKEGSKLIVKEGNRRIAAIKLISGKYKIADFAVPRNISDKIAKLNATWKKENSSVPCTTFAKSEENKVDRVVTLAHGKGEKASRDPWNSVARARHNRDVKGAPEPALDLLEKYLKSGRNLSNQQKDRWSGEFPLSVLEEAMRKIFPRIRLAAAAELAHKYPKVSQVSELEDILRDIGLELIKFETIRSTAVDFPGSYGIVPIPTSNSGNNANASSTQGAGSSTSGSSTSSTSSSNNSSAGGTSSGSQASAGAKGPTAYAANDPKNVSALLKKFNPNGNNRQKVVTLRDELKKLKIKDHPIAFCFLIRSMFEISAKAYCTDNSITSTQKDGKDKPLVDLLRDVTKHLTKNSSNKAMVKILHGAMTEIGRTDGILSVTSMNQLVHNPSFSVSPPDICVLFGNIYPLLETMN